MKGVPEFWLTIFKNVELLQEMVQEHDEAVLKSLYDITVTFNKDPMVSCLRLICCHHKLLLLCDDYDLMT